jgi:hypothetical protein
MHDVVQSTVAFAGSQLQQWRSHTSRFYPQCVSGLQQHPANESFPLCRHEIEVGEVLPTSSD